jgi:alkylated DNA repair protein (DNA oxidative demethylase)
MTYALFADEKRSIELAPGAVLLEGFALEQEVEILAAINNIIGISPLRHMLTPNGYRMSVAMTNCGQAGWVSDRSGYRYEKNDPQTGKPWPDMPDVFMTLAQKAASEAGYHHFAPDACLINSYAPGAKLSLHQDNDEVDLNSPIVSVSLGLPAIFLFGGLTRQHGTKKIPLYHGDIFVFGGQSRLAFHGIAPLKEGRHLLLGNQRINLTFRKVF